MILIGEALAETDYFALQKRKVPFSMATGHSELMYECFPKHSSMETAITKLDKEGKKRGVSMERSKVGTIL